MDFSDIAYLESGNPRQRAVHAALLNTGVLAALQAFDPVLIGTFPIGIDIETSDLDIACRFEKSSVFREKLDGAFSGFEGFRIRVSEMHNLSTVVCRFFSDGFAFEIFGQPIPVRQQMGYRHLLVEYAILKERGEAFRQNVLELKRTGIKTEYAFAQLLGLEGDPYQELLRFEKR